ncbi:hypothetical protein [Nocardia sp. NPDC059228]|uniref:hypothetical protein n=1 Tax=Nocardia sp. NPDC059228 TaxID=3346777 RepID=UPI00368D3B2A
MNTRNVAVRSGLATLAIAGAIAAAGPATADVTLEPAAPPSTSDIAGTSSGSGVTGSQQLIYPFSSAPVGTGTLAELLLSASGYSFPCGQGSSGLGQLGRLLINGSSGGGWGNCASSPVVS